MADTLNTSPTLGNLPFEHFCSCVICAFAVDFNTANCLGCRGYRQCLCCYQDSVVCFPAKDDDTYCICMQSNTECTKKCCKMECYSQMLCCHCIESLCCNLEETHKNLPFPIRKESKSLFPDPKDTCLIR
jgi:hypothetical protein